MKIEEKKNWEYMAHRDMHKRKITLTRVLVKYQSYKRKKQFFLGFACSWHWINAVIIPQRIGHCAVLLQLLVVSCFVRGEWLSLAGWPVTASPHGIEYCVCQSTAYGCRWPCSQLNTCLWGKQFLGHWTAKCIQDTKSVANLGYITWREREYRKFAWAQSHSGRHFITNRGRGGAHP